MEESLFECTYKDSEEILYESYRHVRFRQHTQLGIFLLIAAAFAFILGVLKGGGWSLVSSYLTLAGIYLLLLPKFNAKRMIANILQANNGQLPIAKISVTDRITHQYKLDTYVVLFSEIAEVYFLERCIVIRGLTFYMTFDSAGFTKGSPEELEAFLLKKCPNANFYHGTMRLYRKETDK